MAQKRLPSRTPVAPAAEHALCGCSTAGSDRKAVAVDPEIKSSNSKRLRRIEGQIRGLQKMVEEERYCADIIIQISSVQEALRGVARALMKNHLHHCAAKAIRTGNEELASAQYGELLELIYKHLR
jgi:CsoR family transcriptional regulator, copper-sensing transcriptional repressor